MFTKKVFQLTLVKDESLLQNKVIVENNSNNSRKKTNFNKEISKMEQ